MSYVDRDKVRRERTDWHDVVLWGERGKALRKYLRKGSMLCVEGSLRTSSYDDREGKKRYKTEVVASNIILASAVRDASTEGDGARDPRPANGHSDDFDGGSGYGDEDIPF